MTTAATRHASPLGELFLVVDDLAIREIRFANDPRPRRATGPADHPLLAALRDQLDQYFAGTRRVFELPLAASLGTPFQRAVWRELERIPYGTTICYGELADRVGRPNAQRAVGAANGANPLPIVVPCHRVIGKNGLLTGFGGGLDAKQSLLAHETRTAGRSATPPLFEARR